MGDATPQGSRDDKGVEGVVARIRKALSLVPFLPEFRRRWSAAIDAAHRGQWPVVIEELSVIHERGFATDDSHFWLGCAHAKLADWSTAEAQLGAIRRRLGRKGWEAVRLSSRAEALAHLGRVPEAVDFLTATRPAWPAGHEAMLAGRLDALRARVPDGGEGTGD